MKPRTPTAEPYGKQQSALMEVEKVYTGPDEGKWVDCKICGMGHVETETSRGKCHWCRCMGAVVRVVSDRLIAVENKLDAIATALKEKS